DNERLGDRLLETDGKRNVGVGVRLKLNGHEFMSRHVAHRRHHAFVEGCLAEHAAHVNYAGGNFHQHMLTKDLEIVRSHYTILRRPLLALGMSRHGATCSPPKM